MKKFASAMATSLLFASGALAQGVPDLRLVVGNLNGQSLRSCEQSSVGTMRRYGLTTQVLKQGATVVKIWGTSYSKSYRIQVECDNNMQVKAVAFSHPVAHNSQEVVEIIDLLFQ